MSTSTPKRSRIAPAGATLSMSLADPIRMPTRLPTPFLSNRPCGDISPIVHPAEADVRDPGVGPLAGIRKGGSDGGHVEHPPSTGHEHAVGVGGARVEHGDTLHRLRVVDTGD